MMFLHSLLLHFYPSSFRAEYGEELSRVFGERRRAATNPVSILLLWLREFVDILANASRVHMDILFQDLRYTVRTLARTPGFTLTAVLVTGLGIGANTAVFSVTDRVLLRPLPFRESDRLVKLPRNETSPPTYFDWRRMSTSFEEMSAYTRISANLLGQGDPKRLDGTAVRSEVFPILGAQPAIGRTFSPDDMRPNAPSTVILSYGLWQAEFGGKPDVLGQSIRLNDASAMVIGVMPRDFYFPVRTTQIWVPLILEGSPDSLARDNLYLSVVARLKPGVSLASARLEMQVIDEQLRREYPKELAQSDAEVGPLREDVSSQTRLMLYALFGASLCVLLIACTNLANLLLARAMARRKELIVRTAIGAGRERLIRQLLTESLLLAALGGAVGVFVASVALPLLSILVPTNLPIGDATALDPRVLAFAGLATLVTGLGFGVLPALRMCSGSAVQGLRESSRSGLGGRRERLRSILVIAEISLSIVLLISTGLLIRALWRIQAVDPGFRPDSVLTMQAALPLPKYNVTSRRIDFYAKVLSEVKTIPGVDSAAFISYLPMTPGVGGIWGIEVPGAPPASQERRETNSAALRFVTPGYFETLGIPLKSGRDVSESDTLDASWVAVVSESFVRRYWPGLDPIGRRFRFTLGFGYARQDRSVVGVAGDVKFRGLERQSEPQVYLSYKQIPDSTSTGYSPKELVIKSSTVASMLIPAVRGIIKNADPELPISAVRTLRDMVDLQTTSRSTQLRVIASFALLSLLLAGLGIHGLLSFAVGQRSPEFGLRIALGAQSRDILTMVLREGLLLSAIGTAIGLLLSYYAGRSMQALLAGITPSDPGTFITAGVVVLLVTLSGSLLPAIRAVRIDPTTAIRGD